jgi:hypothetical protein
MPGRFNMLEAHVFHRDALLDLRVVLTMRRSSDSQMRD